MEEFGDILFSLVNVARKMDLDPEKALRLTNRTFMARFESMTALAAEDNLDLDSMDIKALEQLWVRAKQRD